jgi:carboxyl-terminal processing protease
MEAPYAMFTIYKQRVAERVGMARNVLKTDKFDFAGKERYEYDRKDAPWADTAALDTMWKQSVRNDWLRLKLAGKSPTKSARRSTSATPTCSARSTTSTARMSSRRSSIRTAGSIDPHTDYFDPRTAENFNLQMSLSLEGIGAVLQKQDEVGGDPRDHRRRSGRAQRQAQAGRRIVRGRAGHRRAK